MRILTISLIFFVILLPLSSAKEIQTDPDKPQTQANEYARVDKSKVNYINHADKVVCVSTEVQQSSVLDNNNTRKVSPELVVVGWLEYVDEETNDLNITEVLSGYCNKKKVNINLDTNKDIWGEQVYSLYSSRYKEDRDYKIFEQFDVTDYAKKSQKTLYQANFDYYTISSLYIFVGQEEKVYSDFDCKIRVIENIKGEFCKEGKIFTAFEENRKLRMNSKPLKHSEPRIYFVNKIGLESVTGKKVGNFNWSLPKEMLPKVKHVIAYASDFPKYKIQNENVVEIIFRGTVEETFELFNSDEKAVFKLMQRTLVLKENEVLSKVTKYIKKKIYADDSATNYSVLYKLINLFKLFESEQSKIAITALTEYCLGSIENNKLDPPDSSAVSRYRNEAENTNVNHSLAWLLSSFDQLVVMKKYGKKIIDLKTTADPKWINEIQLAIDALKIEDYYELEIALNRMKDTKPVLSKRDFENCDEGFNNICFSHNGKFIVTEMQERICIRNAQDWTLVKSFDEFYGDLYAISNDDKYFFTCWNGLRKVSVETGEIVHTYETGEDCLDKLEISDDGKTMITIGGDNPQIVVWSLETNEVLRKIDIDESVDRIAVSPDCKKIAYSYDYNTFGRIVNLESGHPKIAKLILEGAVKYEALVYTNDGKKLITIENLDEDCWDDSWDEENTHNHQFVIRDTENDYKKIASQKCRLINGIEDIVVSKDNRFLAIANDSHNVWVYSMPELKIVKQFRFIPWCLRKLAFTQDSSQLVIYDYDRPVPRVYDLNNNFKEVQLESGHGESIADWFISGNGKDLISIDWENIICRWDMQTLKLLSKTTLPENYVIGSLKKPDCKYAVLFDPSSIPADEDEESDLRHYFFYDVENDKKISNFKINYNDDIEYLTIFWIDNSEAIVATDNEMFRINYKTGELIRMYDIDRNEFSLSYGVLSEDKSCIYQFETGKGNLEGLCKLNLKSGEISYVSVGDVSSLYGGSTGLIPDGKHFYIGDPGVYICDRENLNLVKHNDFKGDRIDSISFSQDGEKFVVVLNSSRDYSFTNSSLNVDPEKQNLVRIHDTSTCKTVYAFKVKRNCVNAKLTPDNKQVIVRNRDNSFELWNLPTNENNENE